MVALDLIVDLVGRTFTIGNSTGAPTPVHTFQHVPTFSLFQITPNKTLQSVSLVDTGRPIPPHRIHSLSLPNNSNTHHSHQRLQTASDQPQQQQPSQQPPTPAASIAFGPSFAQTKLAECDLTATPSTGGLLLRAPVGMPEMSQLFNPNDTNAWNVMRGRSYCQTDGDCCCISLDVQQ